MEHDPNPAWRAEFEAALAVIKPKIAGLKDLLEVADIAELEDAISAQLEEHERTQTRLLAVITALDAVVLARAALAETGYPEVDSAFLPPLLIAEIEKEIAQLLAAAAIFKEMPSIAVTLTEIPKQSAAP